LDEGYHTVRKDGAAVGKTTTSSAKTTTTTTRVDHTASDSGASVKHSDLEGERAQAEGGATRLRMSKEGEASSAGEIKLRRPKDYYLQVGNNCINTPTQYTYYHQSPYNIFLCNFLVFHLFIRPCIVILSFCFFHSHMGRNDFFSVSIYS
jgi:hypothetical protein